MMPTDNVYGGWAASGEIDVMEYLGHEPSIVHGTLHYGGSWPNNTSKGKEYKLSNGGFNKGFHTYTLIWEEGKIQWLVDGNLYQTQTNWYTSNGSFPAPFDQKFHIILNLAVGGNWPGNPDSNAVFPQEFVVDYVRVYQRNVTSVQEEEQKPQSFLLNQNYPNPFNPTTTIEFSVPAVETQHAASQYVTLKIYNILGKEVATLVDEEKAPGNYKVTFDASNSERSRGMASGIYFYRLTVGDYVQSKKMLMIK